MTGDFGCGEPQRVPTLHDQAADSTLEPALDDGPGKLRVRISQRQRVEVLRHYQAGETSRSIARALSLAKTTVLSVVGAAGATRRRRILTDGDVALARELRDQGLLFREIGEHFGVSKETVRKRLLG